MSSHTNRLLCIFWVCAEHIQPDFFQQLHTMLSSCHLSIYLRRCQVCILLTQQLFPYTLSQRQHRELSFSNPHTKYLGLLQISRANIELFQNVLSRKPHTKATFWQQLFDSMETRDWLKIWLSQCDCIHKRKAWPLKHWEYGHCCSLNRWES